MLGAASAAAGPPGRPPLPPPPPLLLLVAVWALLAGIPGPALARGNCTFPLKWSGLWFQSGAPRININATHFETKGRCIANDKDKYLFEDQAEHCYRCVSIHEKHYNVLEYKETYCLSRQRTLEDLCQDIPIDTPLVSMFRVNASSQPCPLQDPPFNFSYSRNSGDCKWPVSRLEACTDPSRLLLHYQACHDVPSTESTKEELECLADWKDGNLRYLVGKLHYHHKTAASDEERYRCFVFESNARGYNVAQSGDATCAGLHSATTGSKNMNLTRDRHRSTQWCEFPGWLRGSWRSLSRHVEMDVRARNLTVVRLHHHSQHHRHGEDVNNDLMVADEQQLGARHVHLNHSNKLTPHVETITCHSIREEVEGFLEIVAHVTQGCTSGYICMRIYQRDGHVVETQQSVHTISPEDACRSDIFDPFAERFTTFISAGPVEQRQCPYIGRYAVSNHMGSDIVCTTHVGEDDISSNMIPATLKNQVRQGQPIRKSRGGQVGALAVGCQADHAMQFHSHCLAEITSDYTCHGSWEENGTSFLIALPRAPSRHPEATRRFCFSYREVPVEESIPVAVGTSAGPGGGSEISRFPTVVIQSRAGEECHRHHQQPDPQASLLWTFNLTPNGQCSSSASLISQRVTLLVLTLSISLFSFGCVR